jgi:predicted GNAT superfamily acetyltransferase
MTWTFDPLQSKNAHLNFGKLGVISTRYKPDFYGAETSSVLHRNSTDRLWVRWPLATKRVNDRVHGRGKDISAEHIELLVRSDQRIRPELMPREQALRRELVGIEIPDDINSLQNNDRELAGKWRTATRGAFTDALKAGFIVAEFIRPAHGVGKAGTYILKKTTPENLYG